jgi:hypothetical protein
MAIKKIRPQSPDPYLGKTTGDTEFARLAHLNNIVDQINASSGGGGGDNFANANLTATGSRVHDFANNSLEINNLSEFYTLVTNNWAIGNDGLAIYTSDGGGEGGKTITITNQFGETTKNFYVNESSVGMGVGDGIVGTSGNLNVSTNSVNSNISKSPTGIATGYQIQDDLISIYSNLGADTPVTKIEITPVNINMQLTESLNINGSAGNPSDVLISQGTGLPPIWSNTRPYKVYTALLTQTGTDAPTAIVLENTLGFVPNWQYINIGTYTINNALFTNNKTTVNVFLNVNGNSYSFPSTVTTANVTIHSVFLSDFTYLDGVLNNTAIEIRVYN